MKKKCDPVYFVLSSVTNVTGSLQKSEKYFGKNWKLKILFGNT